MLKRNQHQQAQQDLVDAANSMVSEGGNVLVSDNKVLDKPAIAVKIESSPIDGKHYLTSAQLIVFRNLLNLERETFLHAADETVHHLQEFEMTPDSADRASLEEDHSLDLRVRDRERKYLYKINDALLRISSGNYGWCEESGEPIGIQRLLARPTATLSIEAQIRYERISRIRRN